MAATPHQIKGEAMGKNDHDTPDSGPEPDYEVGYGRPPVHSRFGKGNRASLGRPKGARNVRTLFNEAFAKRKRVKLEGREMKLSRGEIAMEQLANRAAAGDPKAIAQYLAYADKWAVADQGDGLTPRVLALNDSILKNILKLARTVEGGELGEKKEGDDAGMD